MEQESQDQAKLFPSIAAQLRNTLSTLQLAAAQLAPAAAREQDPELDAKAALLDQSCYRLLRLAVNLTDASLLTDGQPLPLKDADVVALVEEGMKYLLLKRCTWRDPNFNYRFDGIVYAVFVSLGFAAYENILYVLRYGLSVALPRALFAVPGHMSFAVFMGVFYGRAKLCEDCGQPVRKRLNLWRGYLTAVILHGFYDSCAMLGNTAAMLTFLVFVIIMYIRVYRLLRRESATDSPV